MFIYKITNTVNGKVYIGQTHRSVEARMYDHRMEANRGSGFYLHAAIRKYGWENFSVSVLAQASSDDELNELEQHYIREYNSDIVGYNLAPGGYTNCMSSEKVKAHHDEIMRLPDVRQRIAKTLKDKYASEGVSAEVRQKVSDGLKRFYASGKRPNYKQPFHLTPEHYKALNDAKNKAVYCIDESGSVVKEFVRIKDAAIWWREQGYNLKNLSDLYGRIKVSNDENRYIRGLKWIYRV